jgi:hypothetical protein
MDLSRDRQIEEEDSFVYDLCPHQISHHSSNGSLDILIEPKAKENFLTSVIFYFTCYKKICFKVA